MLGATTRTCAIPYNESGAHRKVKTTQAAKDWSRHDHTEILKLLKTVTKGNKDAQAVIDAAALVVTAAATLMKEAQPILDSIDTDAVAEKLRIVTRAAAENADKVKAAAGEAGDGVRSKLAGTKDKIFESLANAKGEKELKKAIREARQSVLENAMTKITVADLEKAKEKSGETGIGPIGDMPGCFVIATYKKMDFDKDLTDYTGVFVGRALNAEEGVEVAISKAGNPDVYADVKFKQNVHVYVYNCMPEQLDGRYESLLQTFAGDKSYN